MQPVVLNVPFFAQQTSTYCGGASAQMILAYLGVPGSIKRRSIAKHIT